MSDEILIRPADLDAAAEYIFGLHGQGIWRRFPAATHEKYRQHVHAVLTTCGLLTDSQVAVPEPGSRYYLQKIDLTSTSNDTEIELTVHANGRRVIAVDLTLHQVVTLLRGGHVPGLTASRWADHDDRPDPATVEL